MVKALPGNGPSDFRRSAFRLLKKLSGPQCRARPLEGAGAKAPLIGVFGPGNGSGEPMARFPEAVAEFALRHGWIEKHGQALRLSHAGGAWLRRQMADGDPYREQHQERRETIVSSRGQRVTVDDTESPLGWLRRRKDRSGKPMISAAQFRAGERLRTEYTFAGMTPRVTANWSPSTMGRRSRRTGAPGPQDLSDEILAAKERVRQALDEVGPDFRGVLIDICCELRGLEEIERARGWPQRSGKVVLGLALNSLARHYGYLQDRPRPAGGEDGLVHWGSSDFKPSLTAWK